MTSEMPQDIAKGLQDGRYERVGGAIRDKDSQQTRAWLREAYDIGEPIALDVLSFAVEGTAQANPLNLAISTVQFSLIMKQLKGWKDALPSMSKGLRNFVQGTQGIYARLPHVLELIEGMIENYRRFETYSAEIQTIRQVGFSFKEWQQLAPASDAQKNETGMNYITVSNRSLN